MSQHSSWPVKYAAHLLRPFCSCKFGRSSASKLGKENGNYDSHLLHSAHAWSNGALGITSDRWFRTEESLNFTPDGISSWRLLHVMSSWFNLVESNYKLPQNVASYVRSHTSWPTSSFTQGSSNLSRGAVVKNVQKENWKSLQLKAVKAAQLRLTFSPFAHPVSVTSGRDTCTSLQGTSWRTANNRHTLVMTATPVKLTRIDVALLPVWKKWQLLVGASSIFVWWICSALHGKATQIQSVWPPYKTKFTPGVRPAENLN